jgi:hypothetical protein
MKVILIIILIVIAKPIQFMSQEADFSIPEYMSHLKFLSDDLLQGRFPGNPGGDIAALYIASQFERMGLQPISDKHGYFQPVPITSFTTDYNAVNIRISGEGIN